MINAIRSFLKLEAAGGLLLIGAAALAMIFANTPFQGFYEHLLGLPVEIRVGRLEIAKPLLLWVNDGLMAFFFFLVGLELKRELLEGELSQPGTLAHPLAAALGGMVVPALIYAALNRNDPVAMQGWAIPAATDIAFALGILSLLGNRVPPALKIFLVSLAIIDDIGAIIIIALFYSTNLSVTSLMVAAACLLVLLLLNRRRVSSIPSYILVGVILWISVLKSGVHATLAGIALAFFIPLRTDDGREPVRQLEHDLHPSVAFCILPLFAFMNAGVVLDEGALASLFTPVPSGIALGLVLGKPVGILLSCGLITLLRLAPPPEVGWKQLTGVSLLCGIGFTMSLFISSLAFQETGTDSMAVDRLGILVGSLVAATLGYFFLRAVLPKEPAE